MRIAIEICTALRLASSAGVGTSRSTQDLSEKEARKNDAAGTYAKEALPTLHKHLETAQSLTGTATTGKR
jgi:hypothetical protein